MASNIDPNVPVSGSQMTAAPLRANFAAARDEILALQTGGLADGRLVTDNNRVVINPGSMVLPASSNYSVFMGGDVEITAPTASNNVVIGRFTRLQSNSAMSGNIAIGGGFAANPNTIGTPTASQVTQNILIGTNASITAPSTGPLTNNIMLGNYMTFTGASNNVILGSGISTRAQISGQNNVILFNSTTWTASGAAQETSFGGAYNVFIGPLNVRGNYGAAFGGTANVMIGRDISINTGTLSSSSVTDNVVFGSYASVTLSPPYGSLVNNILIGGASLSPHRIRNGANTVGNILLGHENNLDGTDTYLGDNTLIGRNMRIERTGTGGSGTPGFSQNVLLGSGGRLSGGGGNYNVILNYGSQISAPLGVSNNFVASLGGLYSVLTAAGASGAINRNVVFSTGSTTLNSPTAGDRAVSYNVVMGADIQVQPSAQAPQDNIMIGRHAGRFTAPDVSRNILLGSQLVGVYSVTPSGTQYRPGNIGGSRLLGIGWDLQPLDHGFNDAIAIGNDATFYGDNTAHIGGAHIASISFGDGTGTMFTNRSDPRLKDNLVDADAARCLADINRLAVKRFSYKKFVRRRSAGEEVIGFDAPNFREVFPKSVFASPYNHSGQTIQDCLSIDQSQVIPTLVAAVQALSAQVQALGGNSAP